MEICGGSPGRFGNKKQETMVLYGILWYFYGIL